MKKKIIICDIDGCLVDTAHLLENCEQLGENEKWEKFNRNCCNSDNKKNWNLIEIIDTLDTHLVHKTIFLTTRSASIYKQTYQMLKSMFDFDSFGMAFSLLMRPADDNTTPSYVIKEGYIKKLKEQFDIVCAIDDDSRNCQMYKDNGIFTLQVI